MYDCTLHRTDFSDVRIEMLAGLLISKKESVVVMTRSVITLAFAVLVCGQLGSSSTFCDAASVVVGSSRVTALSSSLLRVEPIGI